MAEEMTWRKLPRNLIRDENLRYISDILPAELKNAPLLFMITALSVADDEGIFDLEDGIIFSRLMNCGTAEDVFKVADLLCSRRLIMRCDDTSNKCLFANWLYSNKEQPRTLEQRRQIVAQKIQQEKNLIKAKPFSFNPEKKDTASNKDDHFFCPEVDKITENVVKKEDTEKIREDKNRLDQIRTERKETHTEKTERLDREKQGLQDNIGSFRPCLENIETAESTDKLEITEVIQTDCNISESEMLAEQALCITTPKKNENIEQAFLILREFYAKYCLGFNEQTYLQDLNEAANRIASLADDNNPVKIVASVFISQFKKLSEDQGYFQNMPLTPSQFLKPGVYSHVLAAASKILLNSKSNAQSWTNQMQQYANEVMQERKVIGNSFDSEYIKYNIDPNDPNRVTKLLKKQQQEKGVSNAP